MPNRVLMFCILLGLALAPHAGAAPAMPMLARGINLSSWFANAPRQPLDARDFRTIKAMGFDFARLPVNPDFLEFHPDASPPELQGLDLVAIDRAIANLTNEGLTVVLDMHPETEFVKRLERDKSAEDSFIRLWRMLADHYRPYAKDRLVFELLNEPQYYRKASRYNAFIARVVDAVRKVEPERVLIVNAPGVMTFRPVDALNMLRLIPDPNIIYGIQFYQPHIVTHQGVSFGFEGKQIRYLRNVPYPSDLVNKDLVRQTLAEGANPHQAIRDVQVYMDEHWTIDRIADYLTPAADWANLHNVRVIVVEFGVLRTWIDAASRARWIADARTVLDEAGLGWAFWDYTDQFGIMKLVGNTTFEPDGGVRFTTAGDPHNRRIPDPAIVKALGLSMPKEIIVPSPPDGS